ncbi:hypothetical protein Q4543_14160 [Salipiger sp. 1_MG-2023]|uniref:hypothetical protein n=1 Tax=Salipiger sp. 1_MG-2023 TaxID=3062665 RepID=UPI0026E18FCE|nr:hypothetical protein [Salipiger sp. 1_MG-2023]MDO6586657.1 hypothetical protein [Salipiger sp. 1_MG-2023]
MAFQTAHSHRLGDFNMLKAGLLVAFMALGLCISAGQHANEIAADDDDVHSMVIPASNIGLGFAQPADPVI